MPIEVPRRSDLPVKAPRGSEISCKSWPQEAALRMLMNTVEMGERPAELVICAGSARAARNWQCYEAIVRSLQSLANDETLLIQSGKPAAIFRTHEYAPRVLIANSNLAGHCADREKFNQLERAGVTMYGQLSAGLWTYTGPQGAIQEMFEIFLAVAGKHFGGELSTPTDEKNVCRGPRLAGKLIVSGGMGGSGGAQPVAATMAGASFLGIDVDAGRIKRRLRSGYLDFMVNSLDEALRILKNAIRKKENISVGLIGNCADVIPELATRGVLPDILTDLTSAHDPLNGYVPNGMPPGEAVELRQRDPKAYQERALASIARHLEGMLRLQKMGAVTFDSGNNLRTMAFEQGVANAFEIPGVFDAYLRPLCWAGRGPLLSVALSGDASDIAAIDSLALEMFPQDGALQRWITLARKRLRFEGLPARTCRLGHAEGARFGVAINDLVMRGRIKAPVVIARDQLDCASATSPFAETEGMPDGSDAVTDWPLLNALLNAASGAAWVSIVSSGGTGIGHSVHAGQALVADGTAEMAGRIERVLANDAALAIARLTDAGYDEARQSARQADIKIPMEKP